MSDIIGMQGFGGGQLAIWQPPENPRPAVPEVSRAENDGSATFTRDQDLRGQNGSDHVAKRDDPTVQEASERDVRAAYAPDDPSDRNNAAHDPRNSEHIIAGPSPAFQASLLEVESDLRNVIAKVEARRTREADEAAIAPQEDKRPQEAAPHSDTTRGATLAQDSGPKAPTLSAQAPTDGADPPASAMPQQAQSQPTDPAAMPSGPAAYQPTPYGK